MTYRVAEFARIAGVTVRTLQYYDRIDLLNPSDVTDSGHRIYQQGDLVRLQQIVTLKWMGFSLSQIKDVLDSPTYNLHESLSIQKAAIDAQIERLQAASDALAKAIEETAEADTIHTMIQGVLAPDSDEWISRYYSPTAWQKIQTRRLTFTPEQQKQAEKAWQTIFDGFAQHQHEGVDSPAVQQLVWQMQGLIRQFTGGDPEIQSGLIQFTNASVTGDLPQDFKGHTPYEGVDDDLRDFIRQACAIYDKRKNTP